MPSALIPLNPEQQSIIYSAVQYDGNSRSLNLHRFDVLGWLS